MSINYITLKTTKYYWVNDERVQFMAEVGQSSFFKIPIAKFIFPDKSTTEVSVEPFTGILKFSRPLPFDIKYNNTAWSAPLRESI